MRVQGWCVVALVRAAAKLSNLKLSDEEQIGVSIVKRAMEEPARRIAMNAGHDGSVVVAKVREGKDAFGFNAATEQYGDLVKEGVIDPDRSIQIGIRTHAPEDCGVNILYGHQVEEMNAGDIASAIISQ